MIQIILTLLASRYCTVHNATDDILWGIRWHNGINPKPYFSAPYNNDALLAWGLGKLYYDPEKINLAEGINSLEQCTEWCRNNSYCELARWYNHTQECKVYQLYKKKRSETCITMPLYDVSDLYLGYHPGFCPHNATHQISCTSYQGK